MESLLTSLKKLKLWQAGMLLIVLVGSVWATYIVYTLVTSSGDVDLMDNQQLIPVQRGDLVNQVSISGQLIFPSKDVLTFGTQGTVDEIAVEDGQKVAKGTQLVRLDGETIATLKTAKAKAAVDLRDAEDTLSSIQTPSNSLDVAKAQAAVSNARLSLEISQDTLATLLEPNAQKIAQKDLELIKARISLEDAIEALDSLKSGATNEEINKAQAKVDSADSTFQNAHRDLKLTLTEWEEKLEQAEESLKSDLLSYESVFYKWLGITLTSVESSLSPDKLLASWDADLSLLFNRTGQVKDSYNGLFDRGPLPNDVNTKWNETVLYTWLSLFPGSVMATCGDSKIPARTLCVKREIDDAWEDLKNSEDTVNDVETRMATATTKAQNAVNNADDNLDAAQESLTDLLTEPDPTEITKAEKQLKLALVNLDQIETDLSDLIKGADPLEVDSKRKQVAVSQENLIVAEESLTDTVAGVDTLELDFLKAEVESARMKLEGAATKLENAIITAPWDGIISSINVDVGQAVNPNTAIVAMFDPTAVEVDGIVDEIDILFIRKGDRATVTMDALPGQVLEGSVSNISTEAITQQGIVSYPIKILLQIPENLQVPEGLSAIANVVIRQEADVLLIPLEAVYGTFEDPMVRVLDNDSIKERFVILGNNDDFWTIVEDGLTEGELIVMETLEASTTRGFGGLPGIGRSRGGQSNAGNQRR